MATRLEEKIADHTAVIGVIGMGYIGLSLLDVFGKQGFPLVGYDLSQERVEMLKKAECYYNFLPLQDLFSLLKSQRFIPSSDPAILEKADILILSVPTPLDNYQLPNFSHLRQAFQTTATYLKKGGLVVLQSTTYPGTTEEELLPLLEKSGWKVGQDFYLAHAPEISDIGNPQYSFNQVPRLVSGVTASCLKRVTLLYEKIGCHVETCPSTRVAEAAKILQNTYRLVNISLVNEMKIMFERMGIDIWDVIAAAAVKPFGFTPFYPSPGVGGDCIPVVPSYLSWKARQTDGPTSLMDLANTINGTIPYYVVDKVMEALSRHHKGLDGAKVLLLGVGYKKDVNDLRESASLKILSLLKQKKADLHYHDPLVPKLLPSARYPDLKMDSIPLVYEKLSSFDAVIIATDHSTYDWNKIATFSPLVIDTRNVMKDVSPQYKKKVVKA
jgi:UDP-N-acetyl-D-glucosamine dehydrogenase